MEKPVEQPADNKDTEETTEDSVVVSDKKENTMTDKEMSKDTFVCHTTNEYSCSSCSYFSTRAANTATVHEK